MAVSVTIFRRSAAIIVLVALITAILFTARHEMLAASSPKKRSDIALLQAVSANMSAKELRSNARVIALADPMHAVGFFLEVMALDLDGAPSSDNRRALIAEASQRQPSFAAPRIWLTADDIRNKRFEKALDGADTVMRLNGEFKALLLPILIPLLTDNAAYPLIEAKLRDFPVWRTEFLSEAIKNGVAESRVEQLLRHNAPPKYVDAMAIERSAYLQKLVKNGEAMRARTLWQSFMPETLKSAIFDSDFNAKHSVFPFAWRYASDDYSYAEKVTAANNKTTLVRAHHGGSGKLDLLIQLIALKPGTNIIQFEMRDGGLAKPETMFWQIRCIGDATTIANLSLDKLGGDWQKMQMQVDIPSNDCGLQYLVLTAQHNDGDEAEIEIRKVEVR